MRHNAAPFQGTKMNSDQYDQFKQYLDDAYDRVKTGRIEGVSASFVEEMYEKHEKYGDKTFCSPKQLDWLRRLAGEE